MTKEETIEWRTQYRRGNKYKEYQKRYRETHKESIKKTDRERLDKNGYHPQHSKIGYRIRKLGIRPKICPICSRETRVEAHHPDYTKWNEIVFCCNSCHQRIHNGYIECPKDIVTIKTKKE